MTAPGDGRGPARWIVAGACTTALGLAIAGTAPILGMAPIDRIQRQQDAGGLVVLLGWVVLAWGIHRLGRGERIP